jgi:alpha-tubulin suppressor-like RCC1 family protein
MCYIQTEVEGQKVPTSVRALARHRVVDISMGLHHTSVIVEPGHVFTFGRNAEGQLGIGNTKSYGAPVEVKSVSESAVNVSHVCHRDVSLVHVLYYPY